MALPTRIVGNTLIQPAKSGEHITQ